MKNLISLLFFSLLSFKLLACGCGYTPVDQAIYNKHKLIFIGTISSSDSCNSKGYQKFKVEVSKIFKGQTTSTVWGELTCDGSCLLIYQTGEKYLFYSNPTYGYINDQHLCSYGFKIRNAVNQSVIGMDNWVSQIAYDEEIAFLTKRVNSETKLVLFQPITLAPLLIELLVLSLMILSIFIMVRFKVILLPISLIFSLIAGYLFFLLRLQHWLEMNGEMIIFFIFTTLSFFMLLCNKVYYWFTNDLNYKKSFFLNFLFFLFTSCLAFMLVFNNNRFEFETLHLTTPAIIEVVWKSVLTNLILSSIMALILNFIPKGWWRRMIHHINFQ